MHILKTFQCRLQGKNPWLEGRMVYINPGYEGPLPSAGFYKVEEIFTAKEKKDVNKDEASSPYKTVEKAQQFITQNAKDTREWAEFKFVRGKPFAYDTELQNFNLAIAAIEERGFSQLLLLEGATHQERMKVLTETGERLNALIGTDTDTVTADHYLREFRSDQDKEIINASNLSPAGQELQSVFTFIDSEGFAGDLDWKGWNLVGEDENALSPQETRIKSALIQAYSDPYMAAYLKLHPEAQSGQPKLQQKLQGVLQSWKDGLHNNNVKDEKVAELIGSLGSAITEYTQIFIEKAKEKQTQLKEAIQSFQGAIQEAGISEADAAIDASSLTGIQPKAYLMLWANEEETKMIEPINTRAQEILKKALEAIKPTVDATADESLISYYAEIETTIPAANFFAPYENSVEEDESEESSPESSTPVEGYSPTLIAEGIIELKAAAEEVEAADDEEPATETGEAGDGTGGGDASVEGGATGTTGTGVAAGRPPKKVAPNSPGAKVTASTKGPDRSSAGTTHSGAEATKAGRESAETSDSKLMTALSEFEASTSRPQARAALREFASLPNEFEKGKEYPIDFKSNHTAETKITLGHLFDEPVLEFTDKEGTTMTIEYDAKTSQYYKKATAETDKTRKKRILVWSGCKVTIPKEAATEEAASKVETVPPSEAPPTVESQPWKEAPEFFVDALETFFEKEAPGSFHLIRKMTLHQFLDVDFTHFEEQPGGQPLVREAGQKLAKIQKKLKKSLDLASLDHGMALMDALWKVKDTLPYQAWLEDTGLESRTEKVTEGFEARVYAPLLDAPIDLVFDDIAFGGGGGILHVAGGVGRGLEGLTRGALSILPGVSGRESKRAFRQFAEHFKKGLWDNLCKQFAWEGLKDIAHTLHGPFSGRDENWERISELRRKVDQAKDKVYPQLMQAWQGVKGEAMPESEFQSLLQREYISLKDSRHYGAIYTHIESLRAKHELTKSVGKGIKVETVIEELILKGMSETSAPESKPEPSTTKPPEKTDTHGHDEHIH